ncbi:hypothetical protein DFQ27_001067, partial [Actinomortierella ambigua]
TSSGSPRSTVSKSTSSHSKAVSGQILTMRSLFKRNFDKFGGSSWVLPSGAIVDDRLREVVETLPHESALHSFVIEDVDALLELFDNVKDKEEITRMMVTRQCEELPDLSEAELSFLEQYNRSPEDLGVFLRTHSCEGVSNLLEDKPSEEFQEVAHDCITQVLRNYQRHGHCFPLDPSEAWFNHHLWGFLPFALSAFPLFDYRPGEISSESSARRHRKQIGWESRQQVGQKVNGVVVVGALPVEICWMEAAKRDDGLNTLHDTLKLLKLMKDGHDMIRDKADRDVRYQLATYGLRISGSSRKALQATASSANAWTQSTIGGKTSRVKDWIAPTMTSPQLLPVTLAGSAMAIPPLNI